MSEKRDYLECEKRWVYRTLILVAGFYGGYAMLVRGGAFSNAQTGNIVLMALELGRGNILSALYYLIPIGAYVLGSLASEVLPKPLRRFHLLRWDTLLTLFEILMVIVMGFIPTSAPHQICQVIINFLCAMQYNTFRSSEGVAMATTFCTNHVRQIGIFLARLFDPGKAKVQQLQRLWLHVAMVLCFGAGVALSVPACKFLEGKAIWLNLLPLLILFAELLHADLTKEKQLLEVKPQGH